MVDEDTGEAKVNIRLWYRHFGTPVLVMTESIVIFIGHSRYCNLGDERWERPLVSP